MANCTDVYRRKRTHLHPHHKVAYFHLLLGHGAQLSQGFCYEIAVQQEVETEDSKQHRYENERNSAVRTPHREDGTAVALQVANTSKIVCNEQICLS